MPTLRHVIVCVCLAACASSPAAAQLQLATIRGVLINDADGLVLPDAAIELADPLGGVIASQRSDGSGRFTFGQIAPGRYTLRASLTGFEPVVHPLVVESALPQDVTLRMALRTATEMIIHEYVAMQPALRMSVGGSSIAVVPSRSITRGLQDVVATLPGWATEDNGLLHSRGTDDGFLYVIDGVPVYERLDQLSGLGPELSTVESITVINGYVPAEYGYKAGGVIDVQSNYSVDGWAGSAQLEGGSDSTVAGAASIAGPIGRGLTLTFGSAAQRSDRFLDPVHPDNFHNHGDAANGAGRLVWVHRDKNLVSFGFGSGRMTYDVPNTGPQQESGQDQRQAISQHHASVNWQRAWSSSTVSQLMAYTRYAASRLDGSANDTPLFATSDRSLNRFGFIAGLSRQAAAHAIKTGFEIQRLMLDESFRFAITDEDDAEEAGFSGEALEFDLAHPFDFAARATPTLWSAFAQDDWVASDRLTLSAGLRLDVSRLLLARHQWSPRVGVSYRVADRTVLRASVSRFFQPPQPENLLLSSSEDARELSPFEEDGPGGADVEPERQWAFDAGVEHLMPGLFRVYAGFWSRRIDHAADPNVFAGTTIIFPNAVARGRARGADVRIEMSGRRGWSAYINASVGRVRQNGPITGGLFLEDEIEEIADGREFVPDHDQAVAANGGLTWSHSSGATVSATLRHETGTPIERGDDAEDELGDRPGADLVDFGRGRVRARTVASIQADVPLWKRDRRLLSVRASVLNVFDARYAFNFGNPFSGTHFGAPRTLSLAIRLGL